MSLFKSYFKQNSKTALKFEVLEPADYKSAVQDRDVQLVDVRTRREFRKGHIARARNIDYFNARKFNEGFEQLNKSKPIYIYCRSGHRSRKAAAKLIEMGFNKVYDLKGGINNWR